MWLLLTVLIWAGSSDLMIGSAGHATEASCRSQGEMWREAVEGAPPHPEFGEPTAAHFVCLRTDERMAVI